GPLSGSARAVQHGRAALDARPQSPIIGPHMPRVLGIVMAGGRGDRLQPLTRSRSKAAVPFGARHRIIDYVLSNFVNSGIYALYVLVQYKSQSLIEHVSGTWRIGGRLPETFVTVVPPQMRGGESWYRGTADAVFQNLNLIRDFGPELVAVFGADHVYRMDLRHMIQFHLASRADVSVAARPVPLAEASDFGIMTTAADGRVNAFVEKPRSPEPMPGDPSSALASLRAAPASALDNPRWPIFARSAEGPPARILSGEIEDSMFGEGTTVEDARVVRSILGRGVRIAPGAIVAGSIVMDHTEIGP